MAIIWAGFLLYTITYYSIDETEIKFNDKINALDDAQLKSIEQYVHE